MRLIGWFLVFISIPVYAQLPGPVLKSLQAKGVPLDNVGVFVQRIDAKDPLIDYQGDVPMNPASVMKVLTSYAALDLLGINYRWKTDFYAVNPPENGRLTGDIWVKGSGDPSLDTFALHEISSQLRQEYGINKICCRLVVDDSAFEPVAFDSNVFDGAPFRAYNSPAEALMVNQQALRLEFIPGEGSLTLVTYPSWRWLHVVSDVKVVNGPCEEWRDKLVLQLNGDVFTVHGEFPKTCGEKYLDVSFMKGPEYFSSLFYAIWEKEGGAWEWQSSEEKQGYPQWRMDKVPVTAKLLVEHESPMLADILKDMNKTSNNVMARAIFLALGQAPDFSESASIRKSEKALKDWLAKKGMEFPELVLENGSGLSRSDRISPNHLGQLLRLAYASPAMPELLSSLPVYGLDGTLTKRNDVQIIGKAHLKTGSLDNVKSLAGYLLDAEGKTWVVVFMVNGLKAEASKEAQDALLSWVYHHE